MRDVVDQSTQAQASTYQASYLLLQHVIKVWVWAAQITAQKAPAHAPSLAPAPGHAAAAAHGRR